MELESNIQKHKVESVPATVFYIPQFITTNEEKAIISNIYSAPKPKWTQLSNRRLQNWGGLPHHRGMVAETIPTWLQEYLDRIHTLNTMRGRKPNHVLVNEYLPGQGIMPHTDGSLFYETITTISVGSHTVLKFLEPGDDCGSPVRQIFSLLLEPCSLLIVQDKLFSHYLHCIEEKYEDVLDNSIANLHMCSSNYKRDAIIPRDTRLSLTIRHVPKTTNFKINIGNKR